MINFILGVISCFAVLLLMSRITKRSGANSIVNNEENVVVVKKPSSEGQK